jgi:hypothetical protein
MYFDPSAKALIQFPSARRLLLIFAPSRNLATPLDVVAEPLSDPAKSIIDNLATLTSADNPAAFPVCLIKTWKTPVLYYTVRPRSMACIAILQHNLISLQKSRIPTTI